VDKGNDAVQQAKHRAKAAQDHAKAAQDQAKVGQKKICEALEAFSDLLKTLF
jgi:hypothetical protein